MPAVATATIEDLLARPDRCELVEGEIVSMSPAIGLHASITNQVGRLLGNHVADHRTGGAVLAGDPGFALDERNVRAPDVAYLDAERWARAPGEGFFRDVVPNLVVEVLSPGDRYTEVHRKVGAWLKHGVALVWVIDPESRTVDEYRPDRPMRTLGDQELLEGAPVLPGFSCPVAELFAVLPPRA